MTQGLMSTQELADYLGVPTRTVYRWRQTGTGPRAFRVGKHLRFQRPDVDRWLETCALDEASVQ